jgi:transaldolase
MALSGSDHITIAPALLQKLQQTKDVDFPSLFDDQEVLSKEVSGKLSFIDEEEKFRLSFTRNDQGRQEIKQIKAINIFADMQAKLEELVAQYLN